MVGVGGTPSFPESFRAGLSEQPLMHWLTSHGDKASTNGPGHQKEEFIPT